MQCTREREPDHHITFARSDDNGRTWSRPRVIAGPRRAGEGPMAIWSFLLVSRRGRIYLLFIHNHNKYFKGYGPATAFFERRPINLVRGRYRAGAEQPVWFDEPQFFMDHDGVPLGAPGLRGSSLALYGSVTYRNGEMVLWYPDRKFCLLGKRLPAFE